MKILVTLPNFPNRRLPFLAMLLSGLALATGCAPVASESAFSRQRLPPVDAYRQHDSSPPAAAGYRPEPLSYSAEQYQRRLQKIEALIHAGDNATAKRHADSINPLDLTAEQHTQLNLLYAQILLGTGDAEMAKRWLATILPEQLDPPHRIEYFQSRAFAFSLTGNPLESAKSRIELDELLTEPKQRDENHAAILESLALLPDSVLSDRLYPANHPLTGWMALAKLLKQKGRPDFTELLGQWRENFPGHPANAALLQNQQETAQPARSDGQAPSIALFLPGSGPFAEAGNAVRAGFMAAYNDPANSTVKPALHFYDSEQATPLFLFNQAITDGADFIIGPLEKENIQKLADAITLQVPVLALNHIPGLLKDNLYQFGLSPIDDVEAIVRKAAQDSHRRALLLVPDNAQGSRIGSYFAENWQSSGGSVVETQTYQPKETDFSEPIKKLLNLDESEQRYHKILALLPGIKYLPRKRQDADVLFLNAGSAEARSINPQLHYYQSGHLPVYTTPGVYSGENDPTRDADLNDVTFCDTRWLLDPAYLGTLSRDALRNASEPFVGSYLRLFAMGIDAYQLVTRIKTLENSSIDGATGKLSLVSDNRIKRTLTCARFDNGVPAATDPIDAADAFEPARPARSATAY